LVLGKQAELWELRAKAAVLKGSNEEALAAYGRSTEKNPEDGRVRDAARAVYVKVHRSPEGFDA
jgi:Flp pilus assembly protein TadD